MKHKGGSTHAGQHSYLIIETIISTKHVIARNGGSKKYVAVRHEDKCGHG